MCVRLSVCVCVCDNPPHCIVCACVWVPARSLFTCVESETLQLLTPPHAAPTVRALSRSQSHTHLAHSHTHTHTHTLRLTCVERETLQLSTPRMLPTVRSILPEQAAQDMPCTERVYSCVCVCVCVLRDDCGMLSVVGSETACLLAPRGRKRRVRRTYTHTHTHTLTYLSPKHALAAAAAARSHRHVRFDVPALITHCIHSSSDGGLGGNVCV